MPRFWLFKSEPEPRIVRGHDVSYGIDKLEADGEADWDGVRNYQARNNMMAMKKGDMALYYHSNTKIPGVVGTCEVVRESYVDETAFDPEDPHFDPKSSEEKPRWHKVDIAFRSRTPRKVSLHELKADAALSTMQLFTRARLSVCELTPEEYEHVLSKAAEPAPEEPAKAKRPRKAASKPADPERPAAKAPRGDKRYQAFARSVRAEVKDEMGDKASAKAVGGAIAGRWAGMSEDEREVFA